MAASVKFREYDRSVDISLQLSNPKTKTSLGHEITIYDPLNTPKGLIYVKQDCQKYIKPSYIKGEVKEDSLFLYSIISLDDEKVIISKQSMPKLKLVLDNYLFK